MSDVIWDDWESPYDPTDDSLVMVSSFALLTKNVEASLDAVLDEGVVFTKVDAHLDSV